VIAFTSAAEARVERTSRSQLGPLADYDRKQPMTPTHEPQRTTSARVRRQGRATPYAELLRGIDHPDLCRRPVVCVVVALFSGVKAGWSAAFGAFLVIAFFTVSLVVMKRTAHLAPTTVMAIVMVTYTAKVLALGSCRASGNGSPSRATTSSATRSQRRDIIGAKDFKQFLPLLFTLFTLILFNNLMGILPFVQYPTMSRIAFPIVLTLIVYITYHTVGDQAGSTASSAT
jgi:hypothetical protein